MASIPPPAGPELCVLYGEELGEYGFPEPHPFSRERLPAFWKEFRRRGLDRRASIQGPETCSEEDLKLFHADDYIGRVKAASRTGEGYLDYGDTPAFPGVYEASSRVVGTTLKALRLVMEGRFHQAFCPIAGLHHARRDQAGGFCVFNDIGVAIETLRRTYGIRRIGYVDIDAHHGDGVFYEFESDPDLFIGDIHEDGTFLYPGTGFAGESGKGRAQGTKLNIPLPPGSGDEEFMHALGKIEAFLDANAPEFLLLQCGADSAAGDPLTHLRFSPRCHSEAARRLKALAARHSRHRLIALGGGGYNLSNLAQVWCDVVEALLK